MWPANMHKFKLLTFCDWRIVVAGLEVTLATMCDATCDPYYAHLQSANPNPPCKFAAVLYAITHALPRPCTKGTVRVRTPLYARTSPRAQLRRNELETPRVCRQSRDTSRVHPAANAPRSWLWLVNSTVANHGRPWSAMGGHGQPWAAMACHGRAWPIMGGPVLHGRSWPAMPVHEKPWPPVAGHGRPWSRFEVVVMTIPKSKSFRFGIVMMTIPKSNAFALKSS